MELASFVFQETLRSNASTKEAVLLGQIDGQPALVTLTKTPFDVNSLKTSLGFEEARLTERNDVFSWYLATTKQDINSCPSVKISLVCPASAQHIDKCRHQPLHLITETPEMYHKIVRPYIDTMRGDRLDWVRNILYNGAEADSILYRDDDPARGFVLLPDMKWDRCSVESLYLVAITIRQDLHSIRDLKSEHRDWLVSVKHKILSFVSTRYGVSTTQLKLYFHYQPSYYHLHIHVAHIGLDQSDFARSVLVDSVAENLKYLPNGYQDSTLTYALGEFHPLYSLLTHKSNE